MSVVSEGATYVPAGASPGAPEVQAQPACPRSQSAPLDCLCSFQLPSGEIPLFWDSAPTTVRPKYVKTVFTSAVLCALLGHVADARVARLVAVAAEFLDRERRPDWTWSFFGASSGFPPDLDDTFFALAGLKSHYGLAVVAGHALEHLEKLPIEDDLVCTYFGGRRSSPDLTVNANMLLCSSLLGIRHPVLARVRDRLGRAIAAREHPVRPSYYRTELTLLTSFSMALAGSSVDWAPGTRTMLVGRVAETMRNAAPEPLSAGQGAVLARVLGLDRASPDLVPSPVPAGLTRRPMPWFRRRSTPVYYESPAAGAIYALLAGSLPLPETSREGVPA